MKGSQQVPGARAQACAACWLEPQHQPNAAAAAPVALHPSGGWTARFAWHAAHLAGPQAVLPAPPWRPAPHMHPLRAPHVTHVLLISAAHAPQTHPT